MINLQRYPSLVMAVICLVLGSSLYVDAWTTTQRSCSSRRVSLTTRSKTLANPVKSLYSTPPSSDTAEDEQKVDRTTFDQAGASLIEEEDRARMEQMGDFDANPSVRRVEE